METHTQDHLPTCGIFGRRRIRPSVCIIDRKRHIRTFLRDVLDDLEFMTCECVDHAQLEGTLQQPPDLVVLGLSAGEEEGAKVLNTLAAKEFTGKILLLGPRSSPMLAALQELGEQLKLRMLPVLSTPFSSENLRNNVAKLLPINVPQPPVELTEALSAGWLEL